MTEAGSFVRRNRVAERNAALIAAGAGVVAAFAGAEPTGGAVIDVVIVVLAVGAVVWAAASAPWWAVAGSAGLAAVFAVSPVVAAVGAVGFLGGLLIGAKRQDQSELRGIVAAITVNCLIRSDLGGFHGLSALVGINIGVFLFVVGIRRRPSPIRRIGWASIAALGVFVGLAIVGVAIVGSSVRPDLSTGARQAREAITTLDTGDYVTAAEQFDAAAASFRRAENHLGGVFAAPSRLIPGVAQNVGAGADLSNAAADGAARAAAALRAIDVDSLRVVDGTIDVDAIRSAESPLIDVQQVLYDLQAASADVRSPWLVGPLQDELADLDERLDTNEPRLDRAIEAVRLAPQLLGGSDARRYLIMFTTPAELRGITGFLGNYADVTIEDGRIDVTEFGRASALREFVAENGATCDGCPQEFVDRYGPYNIALGPEREFTFFGWMNITMPAHFPFIAEAASIVYPQSGHAPIDGVIAMDPYVIQALMTYTGPVAVPEFAVTVLPEDAAEFILEDQYLLAGDEGNLDRIDALDTIGQEVIQSLLTGALPVPSELARDLGPLVAEQRLLVWTTDPEEQQLLDEIGLLGALPQLGDDGGFGSTVVNGGNSKIDVFLERETDVRIETAPDGQRLLVADVTLTNGAPPGGLPRYVIGNSRGLPDGTSRMLVTLYGPPTLRSLLVDGSPAEYDTYPEAGWTAYSRTVDVGPGGSVTFHLEFELGASSDDLDDPVIWEQPLADRAE